MLNNQTMKHGSLFSGIGGFDLAAEWMGWENVFHCEWNPFGQKVLKHYWPQSISYSDITKTDFSIHANTIDIISGGFPCQPYSQAGKRKGKEDERHLWPQMLRAIREIQPRWVVGENVRGLTNWNGGMVFDEVQSDLETQGYEVLPFLLPACAVNAPHRRDRIWFIAYANNAGTNNRSGINGNWKKINKGWEGQPQPEFRQDGNNGDASNTTGERHEEREQNGGWENTEEKKCRVWNGPKRPGNNGATSDTDEKRLSAKEEIGQMGWERLSVGYKRNTWDLFPTQPPVRGRNDGIPNGLAGTPFSASQWRNESIKAYGNAIVPQVAYELFKAIDSYEKAQ
jgi:DNA (cytosine-5)-methyltransferase 1